MSNSEDPRFVTSYAEMTEADFQEHDNASCLVGIDRLMQRKTDYADLSLAAIYAGMPEAEFVARRRQIIDVIRSHSDYQPQECGTCSVECRSCLDAPRERNKPWVTVAAFALVVAVIGAISLSLVALVK